MKYTSKTRGIVCAIPPMEKVVEYFITSLYLMVSVFLGRRNLQCFAVSIIPNATEVKLPMYVICIKSVYDKKLPQKTLYIIMPLIVPKYAKFSKNNLLICNSLYRMNTIKYRGIDSNANSGSADAMIVMRGSLSICDNWT